MIQAFPNTDLRGLHPAMEMMIEKLDNRWDHLVGYELIITHGLDGVHSDFSRHYWGGAIDVRTWTTPSSKIQIEGRERDELFVAVKGIIGDAFMVINEKDHFHIALKPWREAWTKL